MPTGQRHEQRWRVVRRAAIGIVMRLSAAFRGVLQAFAAALMRSFSSKWKRRFPHLEIRRSVSGK